ncbi:MAG: Zn-ribbon domain-containing OB-fold protein [Alphaproteobacteria bacterium]|nr:Zn-ribbon domain-containing OB-fold protein [Alphaproteobacteria bacterium]
MSGSRPMPGPSIDSKPYWDGLKECRLLLQQCGDCGAVRHYPRPMCAECHSLEVSWIESSRQGRLYSWTEVHHPFVPGFRDEIPYVMATVELEEGVRLQCQMLDAASADLGLDLPVEIIFREVQDGLVLPFAQAA